MDTSKMKAKYAAAGTEERKAMHSWLDGLDIDTAAACKKAFDEVDSHTDEDAAISKSIGIDSDELAGLIVEVAPKVEKSLQAQQNAQPAAASVPASVAQPTPEAPEILAGTPVAKSLAELGPLQQELEGFDGDIDPMTIFGNIEKSLTAVGKDSNLSARIALAAAKRLDQASRLIASQAQQINAMQKSIETMGGQLTAVHTRLGLPLQPRGITTPAGAVLASPNDGAQATIAPTVAVNRLQAAISKSINSNGGNPDPKLTAAFMRAHNGQMTEQDLQAIGA